MFLSLCVIELALLAPRFQPSPPLDEMTTFSGCKLHASKLYAAIDEIEIAYAHAINII